MRSAPATLVALGIACVAGAGAACADLVELTTGGLLEGRVTDLGDEIRVEGRLGSVKLAKSRVKRIVPGPLSWEEYPRRAAALDAHDGNGHWELACWCRARELWREAEQELKATLVADPQHEGAHRALGHVQVNGVWMEEEAAQQADGKVKTGAEWVTPEEKALRDELATQKGLEEQIRARVLALVLRTGAADRTAREEAFAALDQVTPERKIPVLASVLGHANPEVRGYAVLELGRLKARAGTRGLVVCYLTDVVPELRDMAWEALRLIDDPETASALVGFLRDRRDPVRLTAAAALRYFPDRRVAAALVDALEATFRPGPSRLIHGTASVTTSEEHAGPGGTGRASASGGVAVVGVAGDPIEVAEAERVALRAALRSISGMDFGLRMEMWRLWLKMSAGKEAK
ncbi:MAG: HEAT repeat domain-containing protein [Planctomycetes bacterium]|nr:HEAT repeat domain-containing protein [Planctomycetota bacterium]